MIVFARVSYLAVIFLLTPVAHAFEPSANIGRTVNSSGLIEYAFTPGGAADVLIIKAIGNARRQILVQAFSFTHRKIASALIAAKRRGVDVQIIADGGQTETIRTSVIGDIANAGVPVFLDREHDSAHNKIMVIDVGRGDTALITGSYNFTHAAQFKNAENVLVIHGNAALSDAYRDNWQRHRAHSSRARD